MNINNIKFYDHTDKSSIESYGKRLIDQTLATVNGVKAIPEDLLLLAVGTSSKGKFGVMLEEFFYGIKPPNTSEPDFPEAGVDVKSTPVLPHETRIFKPKERLVLNMINYVEEAKRDFENSSYLHKNANIMLFVYLHEQDVPIVDLTVKLAFLFSYNELPDIDRSVIMADWKKIEDKIRRGEAHLISEGDTLYLGACTKARDASERKEQAAGGPPAKPRAFCYKQSYMATIIDRELNKPIAKGVEPIIKPGSKIPPGMDFENTVLDTLYKFRLMSAPEIKEKIAPELNSENKQYFSALTRRMLGVRSRKIEEFEKANVSLKVIRLKPNGMPKESISFPYFKWMDVVRDDFFEENLRPMFEKRFLFAIFQCWDLKCAVREKLIFNMAFFWTLPIEDLESELYQTWLEVKNSVAAGKLDQLPTSSSKPFHIRPHGRDSHDTIPTPTGVMMPKYSFWISAKYLKNIIENNR